MDKLKKKKDKELCCQICEIQNQTKYMNVGAFKKKVEELKKEGIVKDYAYILHNKDTYTGEDESANPAHKEGTLKEEHIHCMLRFNNSYKFSTVANWFDLPKTAIRKIGNSFNAACAYLVHKNAPEKFQYEISEVWSSFNYAEFLEQLKEKEKSELTSKDRIKRLKKSILEEVNAGTLRGYNFHEHYSYAERVVLRKFLNDCVNEVIKTKLNSNMERDLEVIYIHGGSGTGKTSYAKQIAKERGFALAVSADDRDPVETYDSHPAMLLDEMRPSSMKLANFLKLIDNNTESMAGARYHGKAFIECKLILITSILPIDEFFKKLQANDNETAVQIKRRCKTMLKMSRTEIEMFAWDDYERKYNYVGKAKNPIPELYKIEPISVEDLRARACSIAGIKLSDLKSVIEVEEPEGVLPVKIEEVKPAIRLLNDGARFYLVAENVSDETKKKIEEFADTLLPRR